MLLLSLSLQVVPINDRISDLTEQASNVAAVFAGSYAAVDFLGSSLGAEPNEFKQLVRLVALSKKLFVLAA